MIFNVFVDLTSMGLLSIHGDESLHVRYGSNCHNASYKFFIIFNTPYEHK